MMRTLLVVFVALGLMASDVDARQHGGAVWRGKHVVVADYSPAAWRPSIRAAIEAFNRAMPKRVPRLVYREMPEQPCAQVHKHRGISICGYRANAPETGWHERRRVFSWAQVRLDSVANYDMISLGTDGQWLNPGIVCHELMHAVTGAPDDYANPHAETSCVQGLRDDPGAWDVAYAHWVYKKYDQGRRRHHR